MDKALRYGLGLLEKGQYESAHSAAINSIHRNPHDPAPYFLLGRIALAHRNYGKAEELFLRAVALGPNDPLFVAGQGQFLVTVGRQGEALACAEAAARLPVDDAIVADTIGVIYSRTGFHEKAVNFFEMAVAFDPAPANFHYNLGASLQFSGQFARAEAAYKQAIGRQPDNYRAYSSLVGLNRQTPKNQRLTTLVAMFEDARADPDAALHLGHAMAKTLEDLDRYPESFDWLLRAKRAKREKLEYDVETDMALFHAASQTLSEKPVATAAGSDASPIFIVGLPRTGTTLVDRILSSHPDVAAAGELNTFAGLIKKLAGTGSSLVLDPETLGSMANADPKLLADVGQAYLASTRDLARGAPRFTDKMPLNFFYAGLIHRALPNARIIALRRDPVDSCLANFRQLFSTGFSYYNYSLDILDTANYYLAFDQLLRRWQDLLPARNFMQVAYEDIVHDQEAQTRALLSFCGLEWHEACLRFHENPSPVSTASSVQVRQPLYAGSIGRWKKYGSRLDELRRRLDNAPGHSPGQGSMSSSGT